MKRMKRIVERKLPSYWYEVTKHHPQAVLKVTTLLIPYLEQSLVLYFKVY